MEENQNLFRYIKSQKWDEFEKSLNSTIDLNIKDENSNYLIQYIILYNNIKILKKILDYNIELDWLDNEGRSILYLPIKYGYINIIKILLEYDNNKIGVSILNIKDAYNNFPLHYALFFKNLEIFNMLGEKANYYIFDKNKNSVLHIITRNKIFDFIKNPIKYDLNINLTNLNNETALHIACTYDLNNFIELFISLNCDLNIREKSGGLTEIMLCILNRNNLGFDLISKRKNEINFNIQDFEGNTCLHLAIIDNNYEIINKLIILDVSLNLNICNLDGNTPLHIILYKIFYDNVNQSNYNLEYFLINTNLNIQNNDGQTIWHYLITTKLFKSYVNILSGKKNNLFIFDKKNKTPYDILVNKNKSEDLEQVLQIISESYLNLLKKNDSDVWSINWEKICSKPDSNKNKCLSLIKSYITENMISIPLKKKYYCIEIKNPKYNKITTFTGITLDILTCYIVLQKNNQNLLTSITIDFIKNQNVEALYKKIGIVKELSGDYLNFELFWIFHKDIWPTNIENTINTFIKSDKIIFAIPIGIDLENGSHANIIIIDKQFKTIERFEPNGGNEPINFNYNKNLLDFKIKTYLESFFPNYEYLEPENFLPVIGFQTLEMLENKKMKKIGDPGGFCVGWCLWYLEQRIKYMVHPKVLSYKLIIKIKSKNISFKNLIRSYVNELLEDCRDSILKELNIDINDIINENIDEFKNKELQKLLTAEIARL
jgi:ankyrin repeat protein